MRKLYLLLVLAAFLAGFTFSVLRMEDRLESGAGMLLRLAPVDPRALLMGDYMALEYTVNSDILRVLLEKKITSSSGRAFMKLTPHEGDAEDTPPEAIFARLDDGKDPAEGEFFLDFKRRGRRVLTAASAFYFQEGHAQAYEKARFGRFVFDGQGVTLLVALCDAKGRDIRPDQKKELDERR